MAVGGQTGGGKSVFMNQLLYGVFYNLDAFEEVILVDLKGGVEFAFYEDLSPRIRVVDNYAQLPALMENLLERIEARLARMRGKVRTTTEPYILLLIDEFATIALQSFATKPENDRHKRLISNLNNLAMRGRAPGLRIITSLQKVEKTTMDSGFKNNMGMRVLFRVIDSPSVVSMFGDAQDLPVRPASLKNGQFIFQSGTHERVVLQAGLLTHALEPRFIREAAE